MIDPLETLAALDDRLLALSRSAAHKDSVEERLKSARAAHEKWARRVDLAERLLEKHEREALSSLGLIALFQRLLGHAGKGERPEGKEVVAAELELRHRQAAEQKLRAEIDTLEAQRARLEEELAELPSVLDQKEEWVREHGGDQRSEVLEVSAELGRLAESMREIDDAFIACRRAQAKLDECLTSLAHANTHARASTFGGGALTRQLMQRHIDQANEAAHDAQDELDLLERELIDIDPDASFAVENGPWSGFGSLFLDALMGEWMAGPRVRETRNRVQDALEELEEVEQDLRGRFARLRARHDELADRRAELLTAE